MYRFVPVSISDCSALSSGPPCYGAALLWGRSVIGPLCYRVWGGAGRFEKHQFVQGNVRAMSSGSLRV